MKAFTALALALALCACGPKPASGEPDAAATAAASFMADNGKQPGVVTLPDGLQYKVVTSGPESGRHPLPDDLVTVNYEGKLTSGTIFDSSFKRGRPATFPLNQLVPAWVEALQRMRPGDEWMLYVPPALGYGDEAKGPIPANSVLIFRIQLISATRPPSGG